MAIMILVASSMIKVRIVFYGTGYNKYNVGVNYQTIHAEHDAINRLKYTKNMKTVNVLVFRISRNKKDILCGKPCENCQKRILKDINQKGYRVHRVYYSISNDEISFIRNSELCY